MHSMRSGLWTRDNGLHYCSKILHNCYDPRYYLVNNCTGKCLLVTRSSIVHYTQKLSQHLPKNQQSHYLMLSFQYTHVIEPAPGEYTA